MRSFSVADIKKSLINNSALVLSLFSHQDILKWTRGIVESISVSTPYTDKIDEIYINTHIGGGNHRLFDESHTISGMWEKVRDTYPDDNLLQETTAFISEWFKDVTTPAGMPFINIDDKISYDASRKWFTENIPGVNSKMFNDFFTYDIGEIFTSSFGVTCAIFAIKDEDKKKLEKILGQMSVLTILSANPLMGISVIFLTCYHYYKSKKSISLKNISKGAFLASFGFLVVNILGPLLFIQLVIMLVIYKSFNFDKELIIKHFNEVWDNYISKNFHKNSILLSKNF